MSDDAQGGHGRDHNHPMNPPAFSEVATWSGATLIPDLAGVVAHGPDAATFLHGQLSQDVQSLDAGHARLAGYCSVKGRLLASAVMVRPAPETVWLWMDASVQATTLKRLSIFVMRSKLTLRDLSADFCAVGLVGADAARSIAPDLASSLIAPWQSGLIAAGAAAVPDEEAVPATLVRLPDVLGAVRYLWLGPRALAASVIDQAGVLPESAWAWLDVMSGVPRIQAATADQFVPQMINFELVGGINFKKGCYPGQEIVARSQYRGTIKRRAFVLQADAAVMPGQEVFSTQDPDQPCGMVVNAAPHPLQGWAVLAEVKLQYADGALAAGPGIGAVPLALGALPYELTQDDA